MIYDCDYFIKKFEAIPGELWAEGSTGYRKVRCAYGHCADYLDDNSKEARALSDLFTKAKIKAVNLGICYNKHLKWHVIQVNDGFNPNYPQPTPKQRILAALYDIKKMQDGDAKTPTKAAQTPAPQRIVYVSIDAEVKKLGEEVVMS